MEISVSRCAKSENVIIWRIPPECGVAEYQQALEKSRNIAKKITTHVDVIIDASAYHVLFSNAFFEFGNTATSISKNLRSVAIVGANIGVRTIISAFRQSNSELGNKIYFAETLSQAKNLVCQKVNSAAPHRATQEIHLPVIR